MSVISTAVRKFGQKISGGHGSVNGFVTCASPVRIRPVKRARAPTSCSVSGTRSQNATRIRITRITWWLPSAEQDGSPSASVPQTSRFVSRAEEVSRVRRCRPTSRGGCAGHRTGGRGSGIRRRAFWPAGLAEGPLVSASAARHGQVPAPAQHLGLAQNSQRAAGKLGVREQQPQIVGDRALHVPQVPPALPVRLRQALVHHGAQGVAVTRPPRDPRHRGGERSLEQTRPDRAELLRPGKARCAALGLVC